MRLLFAIAIALFCAGCSCFNPFSPWGFDDACLKPQQTYHKTSDSSQLPGSGDIWLDGPPVDDHISC